MRAGLGLSNTSFGAIEPRGDMDVMLSIRAQGIHSPLAISPRSAQNSLVTSPQKDRSYASSTSSRRSQATTPKSTPSGPVSTIKGLFASSPRPRSPSRATSIDSQHDPESLTDDSFGTMGNHLLSTADGTPASSPVTASTIMPYDSNAPSAGYRLDQKILDEPAALWTYPAPLHPDKEHSHRSLSLQGISLQPPPRKRWTSLGPADQDSGILLNGYANTTSNNVNHVQPELQPTTSGFRFGSSVQTSRAPSIQSVSTLASGDTPLNVDRLSIGAKRNSQRFSRQGVLPPRLTPPRGPPPSIIPHRSSTSPAPALSDRTPSEASSRRSTISRQSVASTLPSFSKRTSGSSFLSMSGTNASPSTSVSQLSSSYSHRTPIPPPRPAPTSALPPAPEQEREKEDQSGFPRSPRESAGQRALRLSVVAPELPPSISLPPRPNPVGHAPNSRRNSATGGHRPTSLSISQPLAPFPPPVGPLPPTPVKPQPDLSTQAANATTRRRSIKQRLRILSAPSSSPASSSHSLPQGNVNGNASPTLATPTATSSATLSLPPTPIAERYENEPSFLQMATTPVMPYFPPPRLLPAQSESYPEVGITPLLPPPRPPRRGSKQISIIGIESESPVLDDEKPVVEESQLIPISRPGSVMSLGIVTL